MSWQTVKSPPEEQNSLAPPCYLHSDSWKNESTVLEVPQSRNECDKHRRDYWKHESSFVWQGYWNPLHSLLEAFRGGRKKKKKYSIGRCFLFSVFSKPCGQLDTVASLGPHRPSLYCGWWTIGSQMWELASMYFFHCTPRIQDLDFLQLLMLLGRKKTFRSQFRQMKSGSPDLGQGIKWSSQL